jgi:hypothetical protein
MLPTLAFGNLLNRVLLWSTLIIWAILAPELSVMNIFEPFCKP